MLPYITPAAVLFHHLARDLVTHVPHRFIAAYLISQAHHLPETHTNRIPNPPSLLYHHITITPPTAQTLALALRKGRRLIFFSTRTNPHHQLRPKPTDLVVGRPPSAATKVAMMDGSSVISYINRTLNLNLNLKGKTFLPLVV